MKYRIVDCDACEPVDSGTFDSIQQAKKAIKDALARDYAHIVKLIEENACFYNLLHHQHW